MGAMRVDVTLSWYQVTRMRTWVALVAARFARERSDSLELRKTLAVDHSPPPKTMPRWWIGLVALTVADAATAHSRATM